MYLQKFPPQKKTLTHCYLEDSICLNLFLSITFQPRFWSPAAICRSFRSCSRIRFCSSNTCPEKAHWFTQFPSIGSLSYSKFESRDAWFMHRLAAFCCSRNSSCRSRGTAFCFRCSRAVTSATAKLEALDIEQSNKVNPFHSFTNYLHLLKKHEKPKCPISFSCDRMRDPSLINCCSDISKPSWHCREG